MKPVWGQTITHMGKTNAIVRSRKGKEYMVYLAKPFLRDAEVGDEARVVKSAVTGHWLMIDYQSQYDDDIYEMVGGMLEDGESEEEIYASIQDAPEYVLDDVAEMIYGYEQGEVYE